MSNINQIYIAHQFENVVAKIFDESGFIIEKAAERSLENIDVIAKYDGNTYYIEVKFYSGIQAGSLSRYRRSIDRLVNVSKEKNAIPVLVISALVSDDMRKEYEMNYRDLIIIDIANLLYAVEFSNNKDELISILPFSVDQIEPEEGQLNLTWLAHSYTDDSLIEELNNCKVGNEGAFKFEEICFKFLHHVFSDDLALWKKQKKSNKNLYRFDLLCRIKDDNQKTVWMMLERFFCSKYIIFEFKNYSKKITQHEVYTTERYLYKKALRNVAIIIARKGFHTNAEWAAKGCFRENGKLIILLSADELIKMYNMKLQQDDPSEYLLSKIDNMLSELEK